MTLRKSILWEQHLDRQEKSTHHVGDRYFSVLGPRRRLSKDGLP